MTPAEKMDEIVRALEEIAPGPCTCLPYATEGSPEECASCDNARHVARALALARELRENAVPGFACFPGDQSWPDFLSTGANPGYMEQRPALLILSDPTP